VSIRNKKYFLNDLKPTSAVNAPGNSVTSARTAMQILGIGSEIKQSAFYLEFGWIKSVPSPHPRPMDCVNNFDEFILHLGCDCEYSQDFGEDLGAEIEYVLNGQRLTLNTTSGLFIPRGTRQGPVTWKSCRRPHVRIVLIVGNSVPKEIWSTLTSAESNNKPAKSNADFIPEKYLVRRPAYEVVGVTPIKNRGGPKGPSMTFMSNSLVPGSNIYIEGGWVLGMPDPNPHIFEHSHNYEEIVIHFGNDFKNPEALGGEIDFYIDGLPFKVNKTSVAYISPGIKHGPLIWKDYLSPHLEMAILPGAGTLDVADPGGHRKRKIMERRNSKHG
jgi:hypothetical protein